MAIEFVGMGPGYWIRDADEKKSALSKSKSEGGALVRLYITFSVYVTQPSGFLAEL
jgi:hypothetical protein